MTGRTYTSLGHFENLLLIYICNFRKLFDNVLYRLYLSQVEFLGSIYSKYLALNIYPYYFSPTISSLTDRLSLINICAFVWISRCSSSTIKTFIDLFQRFKTFQKSRDLSNYLI